MDVSLWTASLLFRPVVLLTSKGGHVTGGTSVAAISKIQSEIGLAAGVEQTMGSVQELLIHPVQVQSISVLTLSQCAFC